MSQISVFSVYQQRCAYINLALCTSNIYILDSTRKLVESGDTDMVKTNITQLKSLTEERLQKLNNGLERG